MHRRFICLLSPSCVCEKVWSVQNNKINSDYRLCVWLTACNDIDRWPTPHPGRILTLPIMGVVIKVHTEYFHCLWHRPCPVHCTLPYVQETVFLASSFVWHLLFCAVFISATLSPKATADKSCYFCPFKQKFNVCSVKYCQVRHVLWHLWWSVVRHHFLMFYLLYIPV